MQSELSKPLAIAIAKSRGGQEAGEIADQILRRDKQGNQLVGLDASGQRAAYFEPKRYRIISYPIGPDALDGTHSRQESRPESVAEVHEWIKKIGVENFAWLHPRWDSN